MSSLVLACGALPKPLADRLRTMSLATKTRPDLVVECALESLLTHWERLEPSKDGTQRHG